MPLLFFAVLGSDLAWSDTAGFQGPTEAEIAQMMSQKQPNQSIEERLVWVSEVFLGAPYVISPLGEGEGEDPDPKIRFDAFDCTTFVETVLALTFSPDLPSTRKRLDLIRYQGTQRDFIHRRHFPEAEWIPELIQAGYFEDITQKTGGTSVKMQSKYLDEKVWARRREPRHLELPQSRIPKGKYSLPVWPLDLALEKYIRIPPGTVLNVVRVNFQSVPVRVSHQGIVIEKNKKLYLRHAADRMFHSVVDEPLGAFLWRIAQYKKWPVYGVNLLKIKRPYASQVPVPVHLPLTPIQSPLNKVGSHSISEAKQIAPSN